MSDPLGGTITDTNHDTIADNSIVSESNVVVDNGGGGGSSSHPKESYYSKGSTEVATETALTLQRLEPRRKLTRNSRRLVLVLVGLPARGKSFLARKLQAYLTWYGPHCKIFNVGKYRREAYAQLLQQRHAEGTESSASDGACDANFFDSNNKEAAALREHVAEVALRDMLRWLDVEDDEDSESGVNGGGSSDEDVPPEQSRHSSTLDSSHHSRLTTSSARGGFQRDSTWIRDRIAIFDATNSTAKRRQWLLEECTSPAKRNHKATGLVFIESICDDKELLEQNFHFKVSNSPDYKGVPYHEAMEDLKLRVKKYEDQYETIQDDSQSYIKVYNLSTKLLVNHIYGRMSKIIVPALMAWNISTRPVFLCRPGETPYGVVTDCEDYVVTKSLRHFPSTITDEMDVVVTNSPSVSRHNHQHQQKGIAHSSKNMRAYSLGPTGKKFSDDLLEFLAKEGEEFLSRRASVADNRHTGTSVTGLAPSESLYRNSSDAKAIAAAVKAAITEHHDLQPTESHDDYHRSIQPPFPVKIFTSTLPRARQTVEWEDCDFRVEEFSNLNPLDKGDFAGMELDEIKQINPRWYEKLERDPFNTRFPGGECYRDLTRRLESVIIDIEQQVIPVLVVSHVSILQTLMSYFRNTPVDKCTSMEVPLHTVIKFTPVRGGGWIESQHPLSPVSEDMFPTVTSESDMSALTATCCADDNTVPTSTTADSTSSPKVTTPIWGDHVPMLLRKLSEQFPSSA